MRPGRDSNPWMAVLQTAALASSPPGLVGVSYSSIFAVGGQKIVVKTTGILPVVSKLIIHYNRDLLTGAKQSFLKYGYDTGCDVTKDFCEDSKFTRYINIWKDPTNTNPDEAVVSVRVSWRSPMATVAGVDDQKIEVKDFIYNYSDKF